MFRTVLYDIAIRTLPRVALETNPNIVGILLQTDLIAGTVQVHWGVSDKVPYIKWYNANDIIPVNY